VSNLPCQEQRFVSTFLKQHYQSDSVSINFIADYSTAMSLVFKYAIVENGTLQDVFIKRERVGHEEGILKREYVNLLALNKQASSQFKCANAIVFSEKDNVLVLTKCQGDTFFDLINEICKWPSLFTFSAQTLKSIMSLGQWLQHREKASTTFTSHEEVRNKIEQEVNQVEKNLQRYAFKEQSFPLFNQCKKILTENLNNILIDNSNIYLAHGDFHPGNFFVDENQVISAIDFQHVDTKIIGYDALYFEMILLISFGIKRYNPRLINQVLTTFQEGYSRDINTLPEQKSVIKALITMRALVYLSSTFQEKNKISSITTTLDLKKLQKWLLS